MRPAAKVAEVLAARGLAPLKHPISDAAWAAYQGARYTNPLPMLSPEDEAFVNAGFTRGASNGMDGVYRPTDEELAAILAKS